MYQSAPDRHHWTREPRWTIKFSGFGRSPGSRGVLAGRNVYRWVIPCGFVWFGFLLSFVDRLIWTSVSGVEPPQASGYRSQPWGPLVTSFYVGYVVSCRL